MFNYYLFIYFAAPSLPLSFCPPKAFEAGYSGDPFVQGLPGWQHHPSDSALQGAGQVQRSKLDGGYFFLFIFLYFLYFFCIFYTFFFNPRKIPWSQAIEPLYHQIAFENKLMERTRRKETNNKSKKKTFLGGWGGQMSPFFFIMCRPSSGRARYRDKREIT